MAKVQRIITGSPYGIKFCNIDHIGMVFKSSQLGICLFEANSATGVALTSWRRLIKLKWYEDIDKISWRKL